MKTIGLVGGLGPEATVGYYNGIIEAFKSGDLNYPEIIVYSVNMSEFVGLMREKKYNQATDKIVDKIGCLQRAGAHFAAITANTPHMLFDQIKSRSSLPLVSIVEATCSECMSKGSKKAGLLGTGFTMNGTFYQEVFSAHGIDVVMPEKEDRDYIDKKLFTEIELGIFLDDTREKLAGIIERMVSEKNIDSVILGCTELPLILKERTYAGVPALDTTRIHVDAIVKYCIS